MTIKELQKLPIENTFHINDVTVNVAEAGDQIGIYFDYKGATFSKFFTKGVEFNSVKNLIKFTIDREDKVLPEAFYKHLAKNQSERVKK